MAVYTHHKAAVFCLQSDDDKVISGSEDKTVPDRARVQVSVSIRARVS